MKDNNAETRPADETPPRRCRKKRVGILVAALIIIMCGAALTCFFLIPSMNYNSAVSLREAGNYDAAIELFAKLADYKDSADQIMATKYAAACDLLSSGRYDDAVHAFEQLGSWQDAAEKIHEAYYEKAGSLLSAGQYPEAIEAYINAGDYKDAAECCFTVKKTWFANANVGDIVPFGTYEQDNEPGNGREEVTWLVLDKTENSMLVVSQYGLDCGKYHAELSDVTWADCDLRAWLNDVFLNECFSFAEQAWIIPSVIDNYGIVKNDSGDYDILAGEPTDDRIFLLSTQEVNEYFHSDRERLLDCTPYACANGVYLFEGAAEWWLRTYGEHGNGAAVCVGMEGAVHGPGYVGFDRIAVRPAMWISIDP